MMFLLSAVVVLASAWLYLRWLAHEDKKESAKYSRIAQANSESVIWPIPAGHKTPWRKYRREMGTPYDLNAPRPEVKR